MVLYKVILVDDEKQILDEMQDGIDWKEAGYEIVGTASNGMEAWELVQTCQPDVVISDINMPFMDGLQLAERISTLLTKTKMVLVSRYNDFDYAQLAVRYQVSEYMLKPVEPEKLKKLLERLREELDKDIKNAQDAEFMRRMYEAQLPALREQFLVSLVEGRVSGGAVEKMLQKYGITFRSSFYTAVVAQTAPLSGEEYSAEMDLYIRKLIEEMLQKICHCISFTYYGKLVFLCAYGEKHDLHTILKYLQEAVDRGRRFYHVAIYCGIGSGFSERRMLPKSFREAKDALEYSTVSPNMPIHYIKDIEPPSSGVKAPFFDVPLKNSGLEEAVRNGSGEQITAILEKYYKRVQDEQVSLNMYQNLVLETLISMQNIVFQYELYSEPRFFDLKGCLQQVLALSTGEQLFDWIKEYCTSLSEAIQNSRMNSNQLLAKRAKEYIDEHYADPYLSVETLCDYLHVSSSHFSSTFSRENGITFIGYLTERRLKEAERLLEMTDYKTREIAEMVGYTEPNYFSYVFKKNKKISPLNYRKRFK